MSSTMKSSDIFSSYLSGYHLKRLMAGLNWFLDEKTKRGYTLVETILHFD